MMKPPMQRVMVKVGRSVLAICSINQMAVSCDGRKLVVGKTRIPENQKLEINVSGLSARPAKFRKLLLSCRSHRMTLESREWRIVGRFSLIAYAQTMVYRGITQVEMTLSTDGLVEYRRI